MKTHFKLSERYSRGFTLIEVMIALAIMAVTAVCSYDFLHTGLMRYRHMESAAAEDQEAAVSLALLAKDIRSAFLSSDRPGFNFVGHRDDRGSRIDFFRAAGPRGSPPQIEAVSYFLADGAEAGRKILRRTAGSDFIGTSHVSDLCFRVQNFEAKYFDGKTWQDEWGWDEVQKKPFEGILGLPVLVSIKLMLWDDQGQVREETQVIPVMSTLLNWSSHV